MKIALKSTVGRMLTAMVFAIGTVAASSASAAVATFTDRASWEAAAGGFIETPVFPGISVGDQVTSLTLDGGTTLTFDRLVEKRTIGSGWATWSGGFTGDVFYSLGDLAVGADMSALPGFGLEMEPNAFGDFVMGLVLSDGTVFYQTVTGFAGADFFGWVGTGVVGFTMFSQDDFAFGRFVEAVPEPATTALLGLGLLGFAVARRKSAKGNAA